MAVIQDVAQRAGVSVGTVSKYLNRPSQLKETTRLRVARAIEELNYRPNPIARSMRTGRTDLIAVFAPEIANPFYAEACSCILAKAQSMGLTAIIVTTENNPLLESDEHIQEFVDHVDGIILLLLDNALSTRLMLMLQKEHHTVVVTQRYEPLSSNFIMIRERQGMHEAARHLLETGRRRIAFIGGPEGDCMTIYKLHGFLDALSESGVQIAGQVNAEGFLPHDGYEAARRLFASGAEPDAVSCANDSLAIGCMKFIQQRGLVIPDDIAVTGFDDIPLSTLLTPELTTVALPMQEIAEQALGMLAEHIRDNDFQSRGRQTLEARLVIRNSTAAK